MDVQLNIFEKFLCVLGAIFFGFIGFGAFQYVIVRGLFYHLLDLDIESNLWMLLIIPFSIGSYPECRDELLEKKKTKLIQKLKEK